ncbi:MarR family protein [Herbihabitans rhizosphaerae]|uniref:MarR family protein n=1 Tax=Herbihabitans rhizosphaerae TaxID=1872711 RepID=A0A4V2ERH8_9PSEU|nr:helix-turn-helix domain-containing protein [Herbihabitans rhizosphaerae]RZS31363.1 MarR family protein [Herbihabitans rhizosphaerae]
MPGGRLTLEDRRQIAAGLAEGVSHAEIARRLARPTSTISREVNRNGGHSGYRAEQAHGATRQRARRSTRPVPAAPILTDPYGRDPEAVREFAEQLATILVSTGMPRMMARVLSCLYLSDSGTLTSADLVRRLRVSPSSVSKAVSYLEGQALLQRHSSAPGRREHYAIGEDVWYRSLLASARANAMLADTARDGTRIFDPNTPTGARLETAARFLTALSQDMISKVEQILAGTTTTSAGTTGLQPGRAR